MIASVFAFRGISAANRLSEFRDHAPGRGTTGTTRTERAGAAPSRRQVWLSARVATDVLPLLVNACSDACVGALPQGAERHVRVPHSGGRDIVQPEADEGPRSR